MAMLFDFIHRGIHPKADPDDFRRAISLLRRRESWMMKFPEAFTRNNNMRYALGMLDDTWWASAHVRGLGNCVLSDYPNACDLLLDAATLAGDQGLLIDITEGVSRD